MIDLLLNHLAHAIITVLQLATLGLMVHWFLAHRKRNGAGEKSPEYWEAWYQKVLSAVERLSEKVDRLGRN